MSGAPVVDAGALRGRASLRVGLVSDTHIPEARSELWAQVFDAFRGVDCILHAGDVHELSVVERLSELAPTWVARGNGDEGFGGREPMPPDPRVRHSWLLELGGLRVGLTHDMPVPERPPHLTVANACRRHFGTTDVDVVVYGHTHVEAVDLVGGTLCVNPGSPTYPHNLQTRLGTVGLLRIDGGRAEATIWQLAEDGPGEVLLASAPASASAAAAPHPSP